MILIKKISSVLKSLTGKLFPQNGKIKIKKNDVYLVSYPKSGNTWMRFLLINYVFNSRRDQLIYNDLENFIPSIHKSTASHINNLKGFRIIKSHFVKLHYPKIVYIVRDGRDALVSYYYYTMQLRGFKGTFEDFYNFDLNSGAETWDQHLNKALSYKNKKPDKILIVKYEDLKNDTAEVLTKIIHFIGLELDKDQLNYAINSSSFKNLKNMQEQTGVKVEDKPINFFRKGKSNQWKDYFTDSILEDFNNRSQYLLSKFNYTNDR